MTGLIGFVILAFFVAGGTWALRLRNRRTYSVSRLFAKACNVDTGKEYEIEPGKPVSLACVNTGLRLSFQCKSGNCGSCEFMLDGKIVRSCVTKVPNKKSFKIKKK